MDSGVGQERGTHFAYVHLAEPDASRCGDSCAAKATHEPDAVTGRDLLPVRVRLFPDYFLSLGAAFPLLTDRLRTVLAVKGSLRRAKCGRALDRSGPLWNAS